MVVKCLANALARCGVICAVVSPSWVQMGMGGSNASLTPEESVGNVRDVFEAPSPKHTGRFLNHDGNELPW